MVGFFSSSSFLLFLVLEKRLRDCDAELSLPRPFTQIFTYSIEEDEDEDDRRRQLLHAALYFH